MNKNEYPKYPFYSELPESQKGILEIGAFNSVLTGIACAFFALLLLVVVFSYGTFSFPFGIFFGFIFCFSLLYFFYQSESVIQSRKIDLSLIALDLGFSGLFLVVFKIALKYPEIF